MLTWIALDFVSDELFISKQKIFRQPEESPLADYHRS